MTCSVLIVGMPSPAACDSTKTWKAAASFVEHRLTERFGKAVAFEYAELFGPDMARHPDVEAAIAAGEAVPPIVIDRRHSSLQRREAPGLGHRARRGRSPSACCHPCVTQIATR